MFIVSKRDQFLLTSVRDLSKQISVLIIITLILLIFLKRKQLGNIDSFIQHVFLSTNSEISLNLHERLTTQYKTDQVHTLKAYFLVHYPSQSTMILSIWCHSTCLLLEKYSAIKGHMLCQVLITQSHTLGVQNLKGHFNTQKCVSNTYLKKEI